MDSFIVYPLMILIIVGSFNLIYELEESYPSYVFEYSTTANTSQTQTLNETETDITMGQVNLIFELLMTYGLVGMVAIVITISLLGASIVGSQLFSDAGLKMFFNATTYYSLWAIFSILAYNAIISIPFLGIFTWFILTLIYTLGIFNRMGN